MTLFVGQYEGLPGAYDAIVGRLLAMEDRVEIVGLPALEFYEASHVRQGGVLCRTEIAIPVHRRDGKDRQ